MREAGHKIPDAKPPKYPEVEVYLDLLWAYNAYWRLNGVRPQGFEGLLRIPFAEIAAYADMHGFSRQQGLELLRFVEAMDQTHLAFLHEQKLEEEGKRSSRDAATAPGANTVRRPQAPGHAPRTAKTPDIPTAQRPPTPPRR